MTKTRKNRGYDPFIVQADCFMQRESLRNAHQHWPSKHSGHPMRPIAAGQEENLRRFERGMELLQSEQGVRDVNNPVRMGESRSLRIKDDRFQAYMEKLGTALFVGAFLVVPMLIMVLRPGLVTSLVTTSVGVFVFSVVMSWSVFLTTPFDMLSATAVYAAILVVFIGTTGGGGG